MKELLCPKWGKCKATKKCPIQKSINNTLLRVYVLGKCANEEVMIAGKE